MASATAPATTIISIIIYARAAAATAHGINLHIGSGGWFCPSAAGGIRLNVYSGIRRRLSVSGGVNDAPAIRVGEL